MGGEGAMNQKAAPANDLKNGISGNVPDAGAPDTTYGVGSAGRLIGPSPENGEPDPRFINERDTSSGGGNEGNNKSTAAGSAQAPTSEKGAAPLQGTGGTTSNLNEGLPSASKDNSGGNAGGASGGTGGGAGGTEVNAGGDARPGKDASVAGGGEGEVGRQTLGAAPYALIGGAVMIGGFLAAMVWARAKRKV